jgi:1-acyl-sn-glycerol-3-phosphate acyltransferase
MLYRILVPIVKLGIKVFYSEINIRNRFRLPEKGPLLVIANHPNTLLDAWLIGYMFNKPIYYLAKATFFKNPVVRLILYSLNMIPINRKGDVDIKGITNEDSFEACYRTLEKGRILVVFPEGNSFQERKIRELKSGSARILLGAEARNNFELGTKFISIGLNYSAAHLFRSKILINVGEVYDAIDYKDKYLKDEKISVSELTYKFKNELEKLLLTTVSVEEDKLLDNILTFSEIYESNNKWHEEFNTLDKFEKLNQIKEGIAIAKLYDPEYFTKLNAKVSAFSYKLKKLNLSVDTLNKGLDIKRLRRLWWGNTINLIMLSPLFLIGLILAGPPYIGLRKFIPKVTPHIEYHSALYVPLGLVAFPLYLLLLITIANIIIPGSLNWYYDLAIYLTLIPLGLLSYRMSIIWQRNSKIWRSRAILNKKEEIIKQLSEEKLEILEELVQLKKIYSFHE